jgi:signal transduction histidine kinase
MKAHSRWRYIVTLRCDAVRPVAESYTGTGLELAIVKDLVERYEGRISVNSTVGEGTTFTVVLPIAK